MTEMNKCERADELVAYFYSEANQAERYSFEQHLSACRACREELAAFGEVRGAVRLWRTELQAQAPTLSLDAVMPAFASNGGPAKAHAESAAPRRSALDALREFFTLTPAWLRAGMVAASLLVCALAVAALVSAQLRWDDRGKGIAFGSGWQKQETTSQPVAPTQTLPQTTTAQTQFTQAAIERLTAERDAARGELAAAHKQVAALHASLTTARAQYQTALASARATRGQLAQGGQSTRGSRRELIAEDEGLQLSDLLDEVNATREPTPGRHNEQ